MKKNRNIFPSRKPFFFIVVIGILIAGAYFTNSFTRNNSSFLRSSQNPQSDVSDSRELIGAILHYATSRIVPQQIFAEIKITFDVLASLSPCNFLVFGLGHDSLMWSSFNSKGTTLFLEEDPRWIHSILKDAPSLKAWAVKYPTRLSEADQILSGYKTNPSCSPANLHLRGNTGCKLALSDLPNEVYNKEWDLIMIDAPKGYFAEAPGRMGAIYSAAVMARTRKGQGVTHVFLHDVNRRVEQIFAEEFLCKKYLVKATGRLWHFEIPPAANLSSAGFCS